MALRRTRSPLILLAAIVAVAAVGFAQESILNDPARPAEERARDAGTKPLELYAFFGVEAGDTVADLMPGGGYNTYILSKLVGGNGKVYSGPDRRGAVAQRLESSPLSNVELIAGFDGLPAGGVDVIITVRNVHDLVGRGPATATFEQWLAALKPGGFLGVVDARTNMEGFDSSTHRINQQMVIDNITAAGFELVETSEMLANPGDDLSSRAETGNRYDIDRMVLKFRRPGQ